MPECPEAYCLLLPANELSVKSVLREVCASRFLPVSNSEIAKKQYGKPPGTFLCVLFLSCGGVYMPLKDGHNKCVLGLGHQHAVLFRENPLSCMDCFIMPVPTTEAQCHLE